MIADKNDEELILLCRQGDPGAFDILVQRHAKNLINFFYRLCWDREMAEDLSQEVFIKLYKNIDNYVAQGKFIAYLYRIARNSWIDALRSNKMKRSSILCDIADTLIESPQATPEDILEYKEKMELLHKTISQLSPEQQIVFSLYRQDMKYADIAETLGIPEGTVKSRLHTIFTRLKQALF